MKGAAHASFRFPCTVSHKIRNAWKKENRRVVSLGTRRTFPACCLLAHTRPAFCSVLSVRLVFRYPVSNPGLRPVNRFLSFLSFPASKYQGAQPEQYLAIPNYSNRRILITINVSLHNLST